jgi:hypothetical protein
MEMENHPLGWGNRRLLLKPPEQAGFLLPLLETAIARNLGLPHVGNGLCRLRINGEFAGIYYVEDFDQMGVYAGHGSDYFMGPTHPADWRSVHPTLDQPELLRTPLGATIPLTADELHTLYSHLRKQYLPILQNDLWSPFSSRQIRHAVNSLQPAEIWDSLDPSCSIAEQVAEQLTSYALLGDNRSPMYVTADLSLVAIRSNELSWAWSSSHPDIIDSRGQVKRPYDKPVDVELTAHIRSHEEYAERTVLFRVMPVEPPLPAIMLYARNQLNKMTRIDGIVHYHDTSGNVKLLEASTATRGGFAHRGGTGYWQRKKPFSLRFDVGHHLLDDSGTRHLYLASGYEDKTFLRNKLSYELFRSFDDGSGLHFAPQLEWAEVFVNGVYHGLYEVNTRVQRRKMGFPAYQSAKPHADLFKIISARLALDTDSPYAVVQKFPSKRYGDRYACFREFSQFMSKIDGSSIDEVDAKWLDVASAIDFALFINVVEGRDNVDVNFYLARKDADSPFFFIPFDFDKTFQIGGDRWYRNNLIRTFDENRDFRDRKIERWRELRGTVITENVLLDQIYRDSENIRRVVHWDYERWRSENLTNYDEAVNALKSNVIARLAFMDRQMAEHEAASFSQPADSLNP